MIKGIFRVRVCTFDVNADNTIMISTTSNDENLDFRNLYDGLSSVYYKGKPFTGVINDGNEKIEYKDGEVYGKYTLYHPSGTIKNEEFYENGNFIRGKGFHENGNLKSESRKNFYKEWSEDGILLQQNNIHYFKNGQIRILSGKEDDDFSSKYFSMNGEWAIIQKRDNYQVKNEYNNTILLSEYNELFKRITHNNAEDQRLNSLWHWTWEVFNKDKNIYFELINELIKHDDLEVKKEVSHIIAYHRFEKYLDPENEQNKESYDLINESKEYLDRTSPDRKTSNPEQKSQGSNKLHSILKKLFRKT